MSPKNQDDSKGTEPGADEPRHAAEPPKERDPTEVIAFEAQPPGPDDEEVIIEPADPPDEAEQNAAAGQDAAAEQDAAAGQDAAAAQSVAAGQDAAAAQSVAAGQDAAAAEQAAESAAAQPEEETAGQDEPVAEATAEAEQQSLPLPAESTAPPAPRLVVGIASGKGGAGKSLLAASIGVYLAQLGKHVVLVDANLGAPALHTLLGIRTPPVSIHDFFCRAVPDLEHAICRTPFRGLGLISGQGNAHGAANPKPAQKSRLLHQLRSLPTDYVVVDLPSGSDFNTLDIFLATDLHVLVTLPEPTAIESTFRFVKSAFLRRLRTNKRLTQLVSKHQPTPFGVPAPLQLKSWAEEQEEGALLQTLSSAMSAFKPRLVVNKTRTRDDLELGPSLAVLGRRHLGLPFDYLGYLDNDDVVWVSVRKERPLLVEYPEAKVSKDIERVTRRILSLETKERPECVEAPKPMALQNHYEILGLHPGATEEEVRRAQRRVRRLYTSSPATYGIVGQEEVALMLEAMEVAQATLVDPEKRQAYDRELFGEGEETPRAGLHRRPTKPHAVQEGVIEPAEPTQVVPPPPMPKITTETAFTGDLLRSVRKARGLELQDIAERTKISKTYLNAIEEEDFLSTPAPVYLRGFVKTLARDLKLDPEQVARSYMKRYADPTPSPKH